MYRAPPRRQPRVAGIATARRGTAIVVLDPWEVRMAVIHRRGRPLRDALLRERPVLVARAGKRPGWLKRLRVAERIITVPDYVSSLVSYPELRRYMGTPAEPVIRIALTLAEEALIHARYELLS